MAMPGQSSAWNQGGWQNTVGAKCPEFRGGQQGLAEREAEPLGPQTLEDSALVITPSAVLKERTPYECFRNPFELYQVLFKSLSHHAPYLHYDRSNLLSFLMWSWSNQVLYFPTSAGTVQQIGWAAPGRLASCALSSSIKACQRMSHCRACKRQKDWLQKSWEIDLMMTHNIPPFLHSQTCQLIQNCILPCFSSLSRWSIQQGPSIKISTQKRKACEGAPIPFFIHTWKAPCSAL